MPAITPSNVRQIEVTQKGEVCLPFMLELSKRCPSIPFWDAGDIAEALYKTFVLSNGELTMMELFELSYNPDGSLKTET